MDILRGIMKMWEARGAGERAARVSPGFGEEVDGSAFAALKESEERYRTLFELCPDAVLVHQDFHFTLANQAALNLFGAQDFKQLEGRSILDLVHPEDRETVRERVQAVLSGARTGPREQRLITLNGTTVTIEAASTPIHWQGRPAAQTVLRDVTRRRQMEAELRRSQQQLQSIIDASPNIIFVKDNHGRFTLANRTLEKCMSVAPGGWLSKTDHDLLPPDLAAYYCKDDGRILQEGCAIQIEETVRMPDGSQHIFLANKFPLLDGQGKPYAVCGISTDISERKAMEAALRGAQEELAAANRVLDETVRERTAELRQTIMDLHQFSYALMHDLRAPLRAVHSFVSILEQECAPCRQPPFDDYIARIQAAIERLDDLIRDSLNYAKLLRYPLPLSAVNLQALLEGMLQTYPRLQEPGVQISLDPGLPVVLGNQAALTECFSNLLDNAVKFARPGVPPRVRVYAESRDGCWRVYVQDNGMGIEPAETGKLFNIFFRLEQKSGRGTGIGLAIVRKAAERMRGKVGVDSTPGEGSRFWVELESPRDLRDRRFPADGS
jgi:PAS domain S-box-containing protein